jgi:DNA-binding MarR family transcriptional regulator
VPKKLDGTTADSAAFSRLVRRLEARGLVLRNNARNGVASGPSQGRARRSLEEPIARADHLLLTEMGRLVAETVKINLG